jgi:hypothetical protein
MIGFFEFEILLGWFRIFENISKFEYFGTKPTLTTFPKHALFKTHYTKVLLFTKKYLKINFFEIGFEKKFRSSKIFGIRKKIPAKFTSIDR